ncbi:hypothetical protein PENTCL1PPCAC_9801, partial [Pristionchus entomophagus]
AFIKAVSAEMENRRVFQIPRDISALPQHNATIHPAHPFLKFQTILDAKKKLPFSISEKDLLKGTSMSSNHSISMCLECFDGIDPFSCRTLDQGWSIGWHCENCGYLKYSNEMTTFFLRGASEKKYLDPSEIGMYEVYRVPWIPNPAEESTVMHLYMRIACMVRSGGMRLREVLGDADFLGHPGTFDIFARAWCENRDWQFFAARLQGVIMISFAVKTIKFKSEGDKFIRRAKITAQTRKEVKHFQMVRSELRTSTGKSTSLVAIGEYDLADDGDMIRLTNASIPRNHPAKENNDLGRALAMKLAGITRIRHTYGDGQVEEWTRDKAEALLDRESDHVQRSWNCLAEILSIIKECLPNDGEYCTIALSSNKNRSSDAKGVFVVENKGAIDPTCLLDDFVKAFRL